MYETLFFQVIVNLKFTEAARGVNKDINVNVVDICPKCQGSRAEPGTKAIRCTYCNGTGMETFSRGEHCLYIEISYIKCTKISIKNITKSKEKKLTTRISYKFNLFITYPKVKAL